MGHKVFISYKYWDNDVFPINWESPQTTVRDYVTELNRYLELTNHICKAEDDNEDLSQYSEDYIWERLKDKIFDSTVTIVLISPNMRETNKREKSQWIPWEIYYSLKETTRNNKTSLSNAVLAVVVPDHNGQYDYFFEEFNCFYRYKTEKTFNIISKNFNNKIEPSIFFCPSCLDNHRNASEDSYINVVKWHEFIKDCDSYIEHSFKLKENIKEYNICNKI